MGSRKVSLFVAVFLCVATLLVPAVGQAQDRSQTSPVYEAYCGGGGGMMGGMMQRPVMQRPMGMTPCDMGQCDMQVQRPTLMVPQTVYQPYQYQGTVVQQKQYRTPVRDAMFGRAIQQDIYAPVQQPVQQAPSPTTSVALTNGPSGQAVPLSGSIVIVRTIR